MQPVEKPLGNTHRQKHTHTHRKTKILRVPRLHLGTLKISQVRIWMAPFFLLIYLFRVPRCNLGTLNISVFMCVFPDGFSTDCLECCHSSHLCLRSLCNLTLRVRVRVYTLPLITSLLANPMEPQLLLLQPNQPQLYCYSSTCTILCFFACKWN